MEAAIDKKCTLLYEYVNRGGLSLPTNYCYSVCCIAFVFYKMLLNNRDAHTELMRSSNHCKAFIATLTEQVKRTSDSSLNNLTSLQCEKNHLLFYLISCKLFKCFAKNFMKRKNASPISKDGRPTERKIRKLQ